MKEQTRTWLKIVGSRGAQVAFRQSVNACPDRYLAFLLYWKQRAKQPAFSVSSIREDWEPVVGLICTGRAGLFLCIGPCEC